MKFDDLYNLVNEAKGTKPGERFDRAQKSEGPAGVVSSPVGRGDYNPEIFIPNQTLPKDQGMSDAVSVIKLLGKAFQLLKNDDVFADQMRGIMNGFKRNRHQISGYQESVIKTKPKTIDNLWGQINNLIRDITRARGKRESTSEYEKDLEKVKNLKDEHQAELDAVYYEMENTAGENEEMEESYRSQMMVVIKDTAKRLYKQQTKDLFGENPEQLSTTIPINELDFDMLKKNLTKDSETQLKLLEMLFSDDSNINPMYIFMNQQNDKYEEYKNNFFQVSRGDNYSIAIEQLYRNLPLFSLVSYFYNVIMKSPSIKLNKKQKNRLDAIGSSGNILDILGNVKNEKEFEDLRPEIVKYIKKQKIDKDTKKMLVNIANGPFQAIRGRANAAVKIIASLKSANITESFDDFVNGYISNCRFDTTDFKLDLMEINEIKNKRNKK